MANPIYAGAGMAGPAAYGSFAQPAPWYSNIGSSLGKNSNLLLGLGAGLLSGNLGNVPQAIAAGSQADTAYAASKKADADRLAQINQTSAWIKQNYPQFASLPPEQGFQLATQLMGREAKGGPAPTTDMLNYEYAQTHPDFAAYQTQKGGAAETSLTPVWGTDAKGNPVMGQLNKAGQFVQTHLPDGLSAMGPGDTVGVKADAKTAAAARAALPAAEQAYALTQQALSNFDPNPSNDAAKSVQAGMGENFGNVLGVPQQMLPILPKTNRANFQNTIDQLSGQAFLNIRQALKGAGQVTDYEGQKGEIALSKMSAAAKTGDEVAFQQALIDYKTAIDNGLQLLREQANGGYTQGAPAVSGQGGGNVTSSGIQWSVSP